MRLVLNGLILILLDFNITLGATHLVGLLPDFIGYFLIYLGLKGLRGKTTELDRLLTYLPIMGIVSLVYYVLRLFGIVIVSGRFIDALALLMILMALYATYLIVLGLRSLERQEQLNYESLNLFQLWRLVAIALIVNFFGQALNILFVRVVLLLLLLFFEIAFFFGFSKATRENSYY